MRIRDPWRRRAGQRSGQWVAHTSRCQERPGSETSVSNELKSKIDQLQARIDTLGDAPSLKHRLRRAVSWLARGDVEPDADARCIFLWIAFNAAYAVERKVELVMNDGDLTEAQRRESYFSALVPLDVNRRIYRVLVTELRSPVQDIMGNVYVYRGFWNSLTDRPFNWRDWPGRTRFERDRTFVEERLAYTASRGSLQAQLRANAVVPNGDVVAVLRTLFDRLNVLRNQLMHGCATQDGHLNRRQVDAGAMVLGPLMCEFLGVMIDHPKEDWGALAYPVRDDIREERHEANQ